RVEVVLHLLAVVRGRGGPRGDREPEHRCDERETTHDPDDGIRKPARTPSAPRSRRRRPNAQLTFAVRCLLQLGEIGEVTFLRHFPNLSTFTRAIAVSLSHT